MASLSPNATVKNTVAACQGDAVNVIRTYSVTLPEGTTRTVTFGPCPQAHADNLASALAHGGVLQAKGLGYIQADGIWA